ncbi:adenylate/guanylate cyclase domain-containing protein [Salinicoccus roseus]|uniref:adenylate/guanylate cyclase domain-containing protein n=1 Tax=Salinicoccus roseus TaxID=45670 RepID=UPI001CA713AB|nr:adenylate/guanylate cyclase domain-containing protein [Salinicoccus roseus]MBY8909854.1 adenylate/guanylate cyclase domain-containing protein [Salinicoccus roseus]
MGINIEAIYEKTINHYKAAKRNLLKEVRKSREYSAAAISDVIPEFEANKLEFGSYDKGNFAVLFVDMRRSTERAEDVGPEKTFLTMHVFLTALLETIKHYDGKVIDIMGDGIMVFWGGKAAREKDYMFKTRAVQNAGLCGLDMLTIREDVINKIIEDENLGNIINIGVGITFDSVIVTKIGIEETYDVKAFGSCINTASKYADQTRNEVKVSKKIKNEWPSGKGGNIKFSSNEDGYSMYRNN